jgi:hypothetical protein
MSRVLLLRTIVIAIDGESNRNLSISKYGGGKLRETSAFSINPRELQAQESFWFADT